MECSLMINRIIGSLDEAVAGVIARRNAGLLKPEADNEPSIYYCPTGHGCIF